METWLEVAKAFMNKENPLAVGMSACMILLVGALSVRILLRCWRDVEIHKQKCEHELAMAKAGFVKKSVEKPGVFPASEAVWVHQETRKEIKK